MRLLGLSLIALAVNACAAMGLIPNTYLVTLSRTISSSAKESVLESITAAGASLKEVYDYQVYQGVLFTVPSTSDDVGLMEWQQRLETLPGVVAIEQDSVVNIS